MDRQQRLTSRSQSSVLLGAIRPGIVSNFNPWCDYYASTRFALVDPFFYSINEMSHGVIMRSYTDSDERVLCVLLMLCFSLRFLSVSLVLTRGLVVRLFYRGCLQEREQWVNMLRLSVR